MPRGSIQNENARDSIVACKFGKMSIRSENANKNDP